jgi:hypothetical protein
MDLQCEATYERYIQRVEGENVIQIGECDNKDAVIQQKVVILELNNYILTHFLILDVVVRKLNTILTYFTQLVSS